MAVDKGVTWISNAGPTDVNAVTWGVFPAKEIIQPTVVDPRSFMVWKDEAFLVWSRGWAQLYPEGDPSRKLLEEVCLSLSLSGSLFFSLDHSKSFLPQFELEKFQEIKF